jgi:hypothetical protein
MIWALLLMATPPVPAPAHWETIAPIIQQHCTSCHVADGPAPFPLVTHDDIARRRSFAAKVVRDRLMPPWLPGTGSLPLHGDRSMPEADRAMLITWLDAGAPVGNDQEPPAIPTTPAPALPDDVISLRMAEAFTIPPETEDSGHRYHQDTWSFVIPINNPEPIRLRGVQWNTVAPQNLHTATVLLDGDGQGAARDRYDPRLGYERDGDLNRSISGTHGGSAIGANRFMLPDGFHMTAPANSDIVAELRYRPSGRNVQLQDTVHLFPAHPDSDSREVIAAVTGINLFVVEAGDTNHISTDTLLLPAAMDVVAILPRARNECTSMTLTALAPGDEDDVVILDIPEWDNHWRSHLMLKDVLHLPAGTRLQSTFVLNNTGDNPRNPFDPPQDMRHGRRTGAASFTLLGAALDDAGSRSIVELSQMRMDQRGRRTRPSTGAQVDP